MHAKLALPGKDYPLWIVFCLNVQSLLVASSAAGYSGLPESLQCVLYQSLELHISQDHSSSVQAVNALMHPVDITGVLLSALLQKGYEWQLRACSLFFLRSLLACLFSA